MSRPPSLDPLFASLASLKGVGVQLNGVFARFFASGDDLDPIILDLLMHMPTYAIDRRFQTSVAQAQVGHIATLKLHIDAHKPGPSGRRNIPHRVYAHDESGEINLVFFGNHGNWVERSLPVGETRFVSGQIGIFQGQKQITHPDYMVSEDKFDTMPQVEPVYPLTAGLSPKVIRRLLGDILPALPCLAEWIGQDRIKANDWPSFTKAMEMVHQPQTPGDLDPQSPARMRLAYDEYLAGQLTLQLIRSQMVVQRGVARQLSGELTQRLATALPYQLTDGQTAAIDQIKADLLSPNRMSRLLQGDVGAGKTIVALMAMAALAESGAQSALMAPTELLATQHFNTIKPFCDQLGLSCILLTGKMPAATRRAALEQIKSGAANIIIGTHALFQGAIEFNDLGLSVVDEQHRFGVHQRLALSEKGKRSDLLVMTATPIPRTLILTHFGDMAVSMLREKPAGRQPVDTAFMPSSAYDRVLRRLKARLENGARAYWVCPLVEESEALDLVSAQDRHKALKAIFGDKAGLIHGRMSGAEKQAVMTDFASGKLRILVATTVIEVGVDVPEATIMIIEHAERFGLAQLHQLRGRVGRGAHRSACLLLYKEPLGETARARLETLKSTQDGFIIAEQDLKLRGSGDVLGTRQSGMPGFRLANPQFHQHLLEWAHTDAAEILEKNPGLTGKEGEALRTLLYLFRRDLAIPLIRAG
ncbi:ATP-dependent DNA helicase RecG [hydrothermal vent metagenome]|uniref:Probable DNA 3'-5' helicase RecG n=1 Tax=hydrothermal vent metagenome TaxID=652676 RepID=A0A3B0USP6_9ZZZZ